MKNRAVIDRGIGETRIAVYEGKKLAELYLRRWSDKFRPRSGDIFAGRISKIDKSMGGAFVALGHGPDGLLKFTNAAGAPRLTEGQMVKVEITREAIAEKGPVLHFVDLSELSKPSPLVQISIEDFLKRRFGFDITLEEAPVNNIEEACDTIIALPGGGDIAIEPTRALIAIDVDKGNAMSGFDVSKIAAGVIAQQLRLRGLGGLIAIDFPNLRQPKQRDTLVSAVDYAVANDPSLVKVAPLSRFGVIEMTRTVTNRSLDEELKRGGTDFTPETYALIALRRLEREALAAPGAQLTLYLPQRAFDWLSVDNIDWQSAMVEKIGARFKLETGEAISVKADR